MENREVGFVVNDEYKAWIEDIKKRIRQSQIKAAVKVNYELGNWKGHCCKAETC